MNARQLQSYAIEQALRHQEDIAPEIMTSYIGGSTREEIDRSIELAKAKTTQLIQRVQVQARADDVDLAWQQANVREGTTASDNALAARVAAMSLQEYSRHRAALGTYKSVADHLGGT